MRQRRGVCQDFAHLQIGCLRSLGLAARYISGYLLNAPLDDPRRVASTTCRPSSLTATTWSSRTVPPFTGAGGRTAPGCSLPVRWATAQARRGLRADGAHVVAAEGNAALEQFGAGAAPVAGKRLAFVAVAGLRAGHGWQR